MSRPFNGFVFPEMERSWQGYWEEHGDNGDGDDTDHQRCSGRYCQEGRRRKWLEQGGDPSAWVL